MKKFQLIIILFLSLLVQQVHSEPYKMEGSFSFQNDKEDELCFETNDGFNYLMGILPSAQVLFNIISEASSSFLANGKTKDSIIELFHAKTKININLSFHQASVFSRYCSAFVQIFLKTACFRL